MGRFRRSCRMLMAAVGWRCSRHTNPPEAELRGAAKGRVRAAHLDPTHIDRRPAHETAPFPNTAGARACPGRGSGGRHD